MNNKTLVPRRISKIQSGSFAEWKAPLVFSDGMFQTEIRVPFLLVHV